MMALTDKEYFLWRDRDRCVRYMREQSTIIAELTAALAPFARGTASPDDQRTAAFLLAKAGEVEA